VVRASSARVTDRAGRGRSWRDSGERPGLGFWKKPRGLILLILVVMKNLLEEKLSL
jgi:hypothetical protein